MNGLFEYLKKYFDNTPQCVIEEDWKEVEHLNDIGPDVIEYALNVNDQSGVEIPYYNADKIQICFFDKTLLTAPYEIVAKKFVMKVQTI